MLNNKHSKQIIYPILEIIFMLFMYVSFTGCSDEDKISETLEINNLSPVIPATGGSITLDITSNATWKVGKVDAAWLSVENGSGTGDGKLVLSSDKNGTVSSRTAEFFIVTTKNGKYCKIELTQLATTPFIELDQNNLEVGARPRSHEIELNTNIPAGGISVEIQYEQEEGDNWIVGINVEPNVLTFQTILNNLSSERVATIILSYQDVSGEEIEVWDMLTVTQMASGNEPPAERADFSYVKNLPLGEITENIYIEGNIVSTGVSDNFRKNTHIIQNDNSSAIAFEASENLSLNKYDKVQLLLDGSQIETFDDCGTRYRVIKGINSANILKSESDVNFAPEVIHITDLTEDHLLSVITLQDVEFAMPYGGYANFHEYYVTQPFADYATKHYPAPMRDIEGGNLYLITNREVTYRRNPIPKGSGMITGLVVKMNDSAYGDLGTYSIRHLEESDINIDPDPTKRFSEILVEWELEPTTGFSNGTPSLPPTTGSSNATLLKDGTTGFHSGNTPNGIYLIDKYRGDKLGANTVISKSNFNVDSWGTGRYWIMDNVSTLGITTSLSLTIEANSVGSTGTWGGPRDFVVEYSLDGESWHQVASYQLTGQIEAGMTQNVTAGPKIFTYNLPDELLNKPNIKIRLMNVNNTSVTGGTTTIPGATSRLAHFSIRYTK